MSRRKKRRTRRDWGRVRGENNVNGSILYHAIVNR